MILLAAVAAPFGLAYASGVQPLPPVSGDGRLGLCDVLPGVAPSGTSWAQMAANAGARINRWELRWDRIEAKPNVWNFAPDDAAVQSSQQAGLQIEGILIATPGWATAPGQRPGNGVPAGLNRDRGDPLNLWATYVRAVVIHYRGVIHTWEIWNEPDLSFFWMGRADQYFRLLKVAYLVIKEIDPSASVLLAGMVVPDLAFVRRVLDDARKDPDGAMNGGYFDAAAWHGYGPARSLYTNIIRLRSLLRATGFGDAPIWVTEDGFPASNPNGEPRQAAYVLQTIAYAMAAGASRIVIYRASDDTLPKTWGLLTAAGVPRMGYAAYQVAATYFSQAQAVTYSPGAGVERFEIYRPGQRVTLLWSRGVWARHTVLSSAQGTGHVIGWQGAKSRVTAPNGAFRITLPGAGYNSGIDNAGSVVGGPPVLLLESNTAQGALSAHTFVPAFSGTRRRVTLVNDSASPTEVQVAAAGHPNEQEVVRLPPDSLQIVDLDLLAGQGYSGSYTLSSSHPVATQAVSDQAVAPAPSPSTTWFAPATGSLALTNPTASPLVAAIDAYSSSGIRVSHAAVHLQQGEIVRWTTTHHAARTVVVRSSSPLVVSGSGAVPRADTSWYALRPSSSHLSLFNPSPRAATIDVRFVGAPTVTIQQMRLAARHSFSVKTHGAKAIVVDASAGVALGYVGAHPTSGPPVQQPTTQAALAAAGPATRVSLFNPTAKTAHVSYVLINHLHSVTHTLNLPPSRVSSVVTRRASDSARGVIVRSDVPVVAAATH